MVHLGGKNTSMEFTSTHELLTMGGAVQCPKGFFPRAVCPQFNGGHCSQAPVGDRKAFSHAKRQPKRAPREKKRRTLTETGGAMGAVEGRFPRERTPPSHREMPGLRSFVRVLRGFTEGRKWSVKLHSGWIVINRVSTIRCDHFFTHSYRKPLTLIQTIRTSSVFILLLLDWMGSHTVFMGSRRFLVPPFAQFC